MKIPHSREVARALRAVRAATKRALKGVNEAAAQRMTKGDYGAAEALAAKGREVMQFLKQSDELLRGWRTLSGRKAKAGVSDAESTPLWEFYQPILKIIVAAGGECTRSDIEAAIEKSADTFLKPGDRRLLFGGRERWRFMIQRAKKPLKAEGWIQDGPAKAWKITAAGKRAADHSLSPKQLVKE